MNTYGPKKCPYCRFAAYSDAGMTTHYFKMHGNRGHVPRAVAADVLAPLVTEHAALQAEVAELRRDAERLDWLSKNCTEAPLRPMDFGREEWSDTRLKHVLPAMVSFDAIGQQISLRDAIDAARAVHGADHG